MSSQDDLGMLWYGVSGVSFNPTDPAEVMLNTGITAPLLSDQPRALVAPQQTQTSLGPQQGTISYGDPTISQQNQMLYDPQTGDFITQADYIYDSYDGYEEDTTGSNSVGLQTNHILPNAQLNEEELNALPKTKKPKVHQHPALKLKTPIAYQKDTDLNAIPIMKEGMAVCEKCGAIGVRHAFYGKERKYCSLACARPPSIQNSALTTKGQIDISKLKNSCGDDIKFCINSSISQTPGQDDKSNIMQTAIATDFKCEFSAKDPLDLGSFSKNSTDMFQNEADDSTNEVPNKSILGLSSSSSTPSPRATPTHLPPPVSKDGLSDSFQWEPAYLQDSDFSAVSVKSFKHAPMSECWEQISPGMKVEVSCGEESLMKDAFWVATVIALYAKLRFEGFVDDSSKDIWVDLCSEEVHPVGWCATQGKPLIPPKSIQFKYKDWKEFLMKRLTGARTLPTNFRTKVNESLKSRFRPGLNLEVVDKNRIAQMRVASVTKVIGKRIHLRYHGAPPDDNGFWCHEDAPIIHPVGWSREVGHEIVASQSYHEKCMEVAYDPDDATSDLFIDPNRSGYLGSTSDQTFSEGMKLEAIDPLNLSTICVATVMKVLSHNYLMIRIDSYDNDNTCSDWFCYHSSSTSIFPAGFCEMNDIRLTPPRGYEGQFSWFSYLTKTQAVAAPPVLFTREIPNHGFKLGMSIEATDLMDPRLVCVAKVKGG
ncbi:Polycomb protein Sfmbt [Armadillidium vulgare]|nr:Polycomb protein Sfmbt [Armadillidium vulgare]